jgi:MscS family membrane protein
LVAAGAASAQSDAPDRPGLVAVLTESPQDAFASFQRLSAEMEDAIADYMAEPSFEGVSRLSLLSDQMNALLDLGEIAAASRREVGIRTAAYLMDIFGRLDPIDPQNLPDVEAVGASDATSFRIPETSLYLALQETGERQGEYLFSAATIAAAPRMFRALRAVPLRSSLEIESFAALGPQLTGPLVPRAVVDAVPESLKRPWLETPVWKVAVVLALIVAFAALLAVLWRALGALSPRTRVARLVAGSVLPLAILAAAEWAFPFFAFQINVSGRFADVVSVIETIAAHVAYACLFWNGVRLVFETVILSPRISDASLDANLLRLISGVIGVVGVTVILAFGGQAIGLPILSVLAGLGIGGLAVALALRPTLENFVGGVMLYIDRPVRVGDFCQFGEMRGIVEVIGVRSTKLRALDRTLITVPNAQFADMQIVNYAYCDQMLISESLGVRYETTSDQLRHVLAGLRRMLHAHPRIDSDTVRVRFGGYGDCALKIDIRVYAVTREWNEFFAIREDVYLRIYDIVVGSGTGFAFPSQTLYLARDGGLDPARGEAAEREVAAWRRAHDLPFPSLTPEEIQRLRDTLDYPPAGSPERLRGDHEEDAGVEPLSAGPAPDPEDATASPERARRPAPEM